MSARWTPVVFGLLAAFLAALGGTYLAHERWGWGIASLLTAHLCATWAVLSMRELRS